MQKFKDSTGREWTLTITLTTLKRVLKECAVDLTKIFDGKLEGLGELFSDPFKLSDVLWCLLGDGRTEREQAEFMDALQGDCLEHAANALVEGVIDFFPNPKRKQTLRDLVAKVWQTVDAVQDQASQAIAGIDPTSVLSATGSPGSSELTPAP